jgi:hypothetical protein
MVFLTSAAGIKYERRYHGYGQLSAFHEVSAEAEVSPIETIKNSQYHENLYS